MTRTRPPSVHLPVGLDLSAVTREAWVSYGEWIVGAVVYQRFTHHLRPDAMVPLSYEFAIRYIPAKVRRPLLDDLIRAGVLECDGQWHFDPRGRGPGKCMCYRLGAEWRGCQISARRITHTELLRKIRRADQAERSAITHATHQRLRDWHDRVEVIPDAPYGVNPLLDLMIDGERRFSVCDQGRVHTNIANLPRQYRQYIRLGGRELKAVDISTSQPLILALHIAGRASDPGLARATRTQPVPRSHPRHTQTHPTSFSLSSDISLSDFLRDCQSGVVYDRVVEAIPGGPYTRDHVKRRFLAVMYGHPRNMRTRVGKAVRKLYPSVIDAVEGLYFLLGHGGLPRLMQRIESHVMILRVAGRLMREGPDVPLLTVHDCIVVPPEYVDLVRKVIAEEWLDEFGVAPQMKVTRFTAPQSPRVQDKKK